MSHSLPFSTTAASYFSALPGFEVHPFYEDFSTPCFDGLHHVIMGGSFMSTGNEASIYSRFHFRPHFFQHASFRVVEQLSDTFISSDSDAPGPFVGNYPFRRSLGGMVTAADESGIEKERYASSMSKNFGTVSDAFSIPKELSHASSRVNQIVLGATKNAGIDISKSNILDVGCGQGGKHFVLIACGTIMFHSTGPPISASASIYSSSSYIISYLTSYLTQTDSCRFNLSARSPMPLCDWH
jgi:hypothetical protein